MRKYLIFAFVIVAGWIRSLLMRNRYAFALLFLPGTSRPRTIIGQWKAWYVFEKGRRRCPAYARFARERGAKVKLRGLVPDFSDVPEMDKVSYIKPNSLASLCLDGKLPTRGAVIDQSSGSTGKPTSWVRGRDEREAVARMMQISLRQFVGCGKQILFVNAFALGPWATGMMVSYSVSDECLLISTGPDIEKIVDAMEQFGSDGFIYVIAGYPPFLKMLADSKKLDFTRYQAIAFYGGEGMSEGMRSYLQGAFKEVYGDYGASDLEINIAAENALTVAVRRLMQTNEKLRRRINSAVSTLPGLERCTDALPHIFQYNQMDYLVETNAQGELLITLCRATNVSPRIKYNIHDNGHVMSSGQLRAILRECGVNVEALPAALANLPFMFHYGRSDLAASYYGCKIPPTDIEKIIFEIPELARIANSFRMITSEDADHNKHLVIAIEVGESAAAPDVDNAAAIERRLFELLEHHNQDYRESSRIAAQKGVHAKVQFHGFRQGPFVGSDIRLKARYTEEKK